jgi:C1A family cysteine protease
MNGCNGADAPSYGAFFAETLKGQSAHEVDYPYLVDKPKLKCPTDAKIYNSGAFVNSGMSDYNCNEEKLKALVATYGAASTSIYAGERSFGNYANGIYNGCTSNSTNHAVIVVGYGTDAATGMDYWIIRNSWGSNWGDNGYIKMQRGKKMCGIGWKCFAAQCAQTSGVLSDPPVVPPPPPIPTKQGRML